jgi:hypothetical protein
MKSESEKSRTSEAPIEESQGNPVFPAQTPNLESSAIQKRQEASQSIAELLLQKDSHSKSQLAKFRQIEKSRELLELQEAPKINPNSIKHLKSRSQEDILSVIKSLPSKSKGKQKKKRVTRVDNRRPQDFIPGPDLSSIKHVLNRVPTKEKKEKVDLKSLNLVEKTKYFENKKNEKIKEAEKKKEINEKKICTFKPNLKREKNRATTEKSVSEKTSPKLSRCQSTSNNQETTEVIRIPAPNKHVKTSSTGLTEQSLFLTSHYSQFSPLTKIYGFKEGANIKELKSRSQAMLTYNAYTNRK